MLKILTVLICAVTAGFFTSATAQAQINFQEKPLLQIIKELESNTDYRFLYREAQLTGIHLSFTAGKQDFPDSLRTHLLPHNISVEADTIRKQIVLFSKLNSNPKNIRINGQVVDAQTGERLPFAAIYWEGKTGRKGIAGNSSGVFKISAATPSQTFTFHIAYLSYETQTVSLNLSRGNAFRDVTIRLNPVAVQSNEIVVTGLNYIAGSDSIYRSFVNAGVLNPFGENNTTRALQSLPSVSFATALNNGINVRGSSADATQILLDGITIYNQSHLFGLLDSFNPNALQNSGFFYDVTPARLQSSPGGTLSMLTKTGSLNRFNSSAGLSNTAFNTTLHGPVIPGRSSWFFSGRTSYLNTLNWFQNDELIAFGLNIDRPAEVTSGNISNLQSRLTTPGDYQAGFFDLHGKIYFEFKNGSRLLLGTYFGGDDVSQDAQRLVRRFNPNKPGQRFVREQVETNNRWGNFSSSISFKTPVSESIYSHSMVAVSIYDTRFSKDDFVYNRVERNQGRVEVFTFPLRNKSVFNEFKVDQSFDWAAAQTQWTFGVSYQYFMGEYFEESFDRPGFITNFKSNLFDVYAQAEFDPLNSLNIQAGSRLHYYTSGAFLGYSPRLKLNILENHPLSFGLGFSRNFQFVHRLSFYNISSPDVWIISDNQQPPTSADYFSGGIYLRPFSHTLFQVEGYYKNMQNVRLFEINAQTLTGSFDAPPWLYKNAGVSQGIEFLLRNRFRKLTLTNAYTLSEAVFKNPAVLDNEKFYAQWDRTHSYHAVAEYRVLSSLKIFTSLTIASGAPNRLHFLQVEDEPRLDGYQRIDAGIEYRKEFGDSELEANFSVFNVLNRQNTWYRELNLVIDNSVPASQRRLSSSVINVYDLGIQPSFNVTVWF